MHDLRRDGSDLPRRMATVPEGPRVSALERVEGMGRVSSRRSAPAALYVERLSRSPHRLIRIDLILGPVPRIKSIRIRRCGDLLRRSTYRAAGPLRRVLPRPMPTTRSRALTRGPSITVAIRCRRSFVTPAEHDQCTIAPQAASFVASLAGLLAFWPDRSAWADAPIVALW